MTKPMTQDRLTFRKQLADGRVVAVNFWPTGWQELVYANRTAFEQAKEAVETRGEVPNPIGFAAI